MVPHEQLDQNGPPKLGEELWSRMAALEGVSAGRSAISAPTSRAVHLDPDLAVGPPEAYIVGTEFAHLHGAHDGSLHATLPREAAGVAIDRGWGELHPVARTGGRAPTLMMLYSPRDQTELEEIWKLVEISYRFARGAWPLPPAQRH
jgi:hypothetical protein